MMVLCIWVARSCIICHTIHTTYAKRHTISRGFPHRKSPIRSTRRTPYSAHPMVQPCAARDGAALAPDGDPPMRSNLASTLESSVRYVTYECQRSTSSPESAALSSARRTPCCDAMDTRPGYRGEFCGRWVVHFHGQVPWGVTDAQMSPGQGRGLRGTYQALRPHATVGWHAVQANWRVQTRTHHDDPRLRAPRPQEQADAQRVVQRHQLHRHLCTRQGRERGST
jgi:hypothetical protein